MLGRLPLAVAALGLGSCNDVPRLPPSHGMVAVSPVSHDFGALAVGQTSPGFIETINPGMGTQSGEVTAVTASCPDFVIQARGLPANVSRACDAASAQGKDPCWTTDLESYSFTASFQPSFVGTQSCVVGVELNDGLNGATVKTVTLTGTGIGTPTPIGIDVAPRSIHFGDVRRNASSSAANLAIKNLGATALFVLYIDVTGPYQLDSPSSFVVAPHSVYDVGVACTPAATGPVTSAVKITSNDPTTPSITVPLDCNGIDSNLGISPSPVVFPPTRVGEPMMQTIDVVNTGTATTTLQRVTLTGAGLSIVSAPADNTDIGAGQTVQVQIAFDAAANGSTTGTLDVATTDGVRTAKLSAIANLASMSVTPDGAVDFGPVCPGQSAVHQFAVLGTSTGAFRLQALDDPDPPFTMTRPSLPANIQGSGTNQVTFAVTVSPIAEGVASSVIALATDIPNELPRTIDLTVTGVAGGVTATPAQLDLGSPPVGVTTIGQPVTVANCTTEAITYSNARIEGGDAAFAIVAPPANTTVPTAGAAEWLVVFKADTAGPRKATFVVDYPGGSASVPLTGEGFDPHASPPIVDAPSYYTCSSGRAPASWPVGLAVVLVARRRRRRHAR